MNQIEYYCVSHTGLVRKQNQDNYYCADELLLDGMKEGKIIEGATDFKNCDLFAVFDGLGGEERGDVAALLAAKTLRNHIGPGSQVVLQPGKVGTLSGLCNVMHKSILEYMAQEKIRTMGTTVAMVRFRKDAMELCNVGDSKIFRLRDHQLVQLSQDHTIISLGKRKPPLYQYLGWHDLDEGYGENGSCIDPYVDSCRCKEGDIYLVCSDGLTDTLNNDEIKEILEQNSGEQMAGQLLEKSLAQGGIDNITLICLKVNEVENMKEIMDVSEIWPGWETEECIGKGAYGAVYRIVNRYITQAGDMALKVLSIPLDDQETDNLFYEGMTEENAKTYYQALVNDFIHEIELMNLLRDCNNIVKIKDFKVIEKEGKVGFYILIRMELLTSLNVYLSDKQLSEKEVLKIGYDLCKALEVCSNHKIIHRDIKPENVFVDADGNFKLGDFGIAKKMENANASLSQKGTFNYMAPEVICSIDYDERVDIYSLGILLYKLLNENRLPFVDTKKQLLSPADRKNALERRIRGEQLPAPVSASEEVAALILKACAYEAKDRFLNASEMKKAIGLLLEEEENKKDAKSEQNIQENPLTLEPGAVLETNPTTEANAYAEKAPVVVVYETSEKKTKEGWIKKFKKPAIVGIAVGSVIVLGLISFSAYHIGLSKAKANAHLALEGKIDQVESQEVWITDEEPGTTEAVLVDVIENQVVVTGPVEDLIVEQTMEPLNISEEDSVGEENPYADALLKAGKELLASGDYDGAKMIFAQMGTTQGEIMVCQCDYEKANEMLLNGQEEEAGVILMNLLDKDDWLAYLSKDYGARPESSTNEGDYDAEAGNIKISKRDRYWHAGAAAIIIDYVDDDDIPDQFSVRAVKKDGEGYGFFYYKMDGTLVRKWIF